MSTALEGLGRRWRFNERLLALTTKGFQEGDWTAPPGPGGGNSAQWILAHVVHHRRLAARRLGQELALSPWEEGVKARSDGRLRPDTPTPAALTEELGRLGEQVQRALAGLSDAQAAEPWGNAFPDGGSTVADGAHFLYFHESYHLGQLGLVRRLRGKPGFV